MYAVPHVEEVSGKSTEKVEEVKVEEPTTSDNSGSSILEDYLGRSSNVVKKNVIEDKLSENQLKELLKLEKSDKNRSAVKNWNKKNEIFINAHILTMISINPMVLTSILLEVKKRSNFFSKLNPISIQSPPAPR